MFSRRSGIDTDYDVNVISVEEKGVSVLSTDWSAENIFVEFDDMGNVKDHPRGTYLWNILKIEMELSNEMYPPSLEGILGGAVYRRKEGPYRYCRDGRATREAHKQHKKDGYELNRRIHYALRDPRAETATDHLASNERLKEIIDALPVLNPSEKDGFNINTLAKLSQQDREAIFQELDKVIPIHGGYKALYEKWVNENVDFLDALNIELPPDFEAKWRDLQDEFED